MHSRLSSLLIAALAVAAFGGLAASAGAEHGADDPVTDVRQSHGADDTAGGLPASQGADDPAGDLQHTAADDSKATHRKRAHRRGHRGHRAHHRAAHARHGHGADDAPNHG
jgi:hypothetical protein